MSALGEGRLFALTGEEALAVAARSSLPCFAYRLDLARSRYDELRAVLPRRAVLAYAVKANPGLPLVAALAERGAWLDCASIGELGLARSARLPGSRLLFAGPGKSLEELSLALSIGARIQADGIEDLERLDALLAGAECSGEEAAGEEAECLPRSAPLALSLRVNPASGITEGSRIIGGAGPSAFGVDEEELDPFLAEASRFERLRITGLQVFAASNELRSERLLGNYRATMAIAERLQRSLGLPLELVDLGGGLGIPYSAAEEELDIAELGAGLGRILEENPWFSGKVVVEPGRWLSGPIGVYLARAVRVKESRGTRFAILEGGINHLLRPLLTGQGFPAFAPGAKGESVPHTLAGPLCTALDRLGEALLPPLEAGSLVMLGQAGAYGATEAMTRFLLHPEAAELWLEGSPLAAPSDRMPKRKEQP
jgi:diaminopimelate decarboxylase